MKKFIKNLILASVITTCGIGLVSCGDSDKDTNNSTINPSTVEPNGSTGDIQQGAIEYKVTVKCFNGKPIKDVNVSVVVDGKEQFEKTNVYGEVKFNLLPGEYEVQIDTDSLLGYTFENTKIKTKKTGEDIEFVGEASLITEQAVPNDYTYYLGDLMYDFTYTTIKNETKTLSEALDQYDLVLINFWYPGCSWCFYEFPALEEAYQNNKDNILVIALDNHGSTMSEIIDYCENDVELSFDVAKDTTNLSDNFVIKGDPTTVYVDRYGLIGGIHEGAITEVERWQYEIDKYLGSDYEPTFSGYISEDGQTSTQIKPTVDPVDSKELENVANGSNFTGTYSEETGPNSEYVWPWIVDEDKQAMKPSNYDINNSYSIVYTKFTLGVNQILAFDFLKSCESEDKLYVFVDGIQKIELSGKANEFDTCYLFASDDTVEHTLGFAYIKDDTYMTGDDCVYIKNIRYIDGDSITDPIYLLKNCAYGDYNMLTNKFDGYITPVYNEEDMLYHVNDVNGPLLLVDLGNDTLWSDEKSLYEYYFEEELKFADKDYSTLIKKFSEYQGNSTVGYTSVTKELYEALDDIVTRISGRDYDEQLLELCSYYQPYGTDKQLENPIKGLVYFDTYDAVLGDQNFVTYDRIIVPRGLLYNFTPEKSGAYKFTTYGSSDTIGWIYNGDGGFLYQSNTGLRESYKYRTENTYFDPNFVIYCYLEAGTTYYLDAAFYNVDEFGTIQFGIEYLDASYDVLTACSLGYFTTDTADWSGTEEVNIISIGVDAQLQEDGYYHYVAEDGTVGGIIYADFTLLNAIFDQSLISLLDTDSYQFTIDIDGNVISVDMTENMRNYQSKMITTEGEMYGLVAVDANLQKILQLLMDKYTFAGVEGSWLKLCYYYHHYGA